MTTSATTLIETEARLGAHNYKPLDVVLTRGEGVWVWDVDGNRYLDCLSAYSAVNQGHCHPKILAAMVEQARQADPDLARLPQRPAGAVLRGARGADRLAQGAADEQRRRGGGDPRSRRSRKWGYEVKGVPDGPGRDHRLRRTTSTAARSASSASRTDPDARGGFGPFAPGFKVVPFGDADALRGGDHAEHRRLPGRADPGRGRRDHPAGRLLQDACASSAPGTTSC